MIARQFIAATRHLAPEISPTLSKLESPALARLTEEAALIRLTEGAAHPRQAATRGSHEPVQLNLFPDWPDAGKVAQSGTVETSTTPLRRIFVGSESAKRLNFDRPMIGTLNAKEILPDGRLSGTKFLAFHHMDDAGKVQISRESAVTLSKCDIVFTCHPEVLTEHVSIGKYLLKKHAMPEATGRLSVRHSNIRVFDPESKRYGYLFDVVNEPFMKEVRGVTHRHISTQMSLPFEKNLNNRAPLGLVKKENPWLFVDNPAAIASR